MKIGFRDDASNLRQAAKQGPVRHTSTTNISNVMAWIASPLTRLGRPQKQQRTTWEEDVEKAVQAFSSTWLKESRSSRTMIYCIGRYITAGH